MSKGGRGRIGRAIGWMVGIPFASWRYAARDVEIHRDESDCPWPIEGFPSGEERHAGSGGAVQHPAGGSGPAFRRRYRVRVERPLIDAGELMAIVCNDPNVACPLEIARFERDDATRPIEVGEEMLVRLPGPWNGPVRVIDKGERSFRLTTLRGHMEAGEIEFRAQDEGGELVFDIESWARSSDRLFDLVYGRIGLARELQLDMWAFFLERVAQISGGGAGRGIELQTRQCDSHPF